MNESLVIGVLILLVASRCIPMLILKGYMWRWHLVPRNKLFNIYLHVFIGNDERTFHDHPWASWSVCLWGTLDEYSLCATDINGHGGVINQSSLSTGAVVVRRVEHRHYLTLRSRFAVTLFCTGPMKTDGTWYFYPRDRYKRVPYWEWPQAFTAWRWSWKHLKYVEY